MRNSKEYSARGVLNWLRKLPKNTKIINTLIVLIIILFSFIFISIIGIQSFQYLKLNLVGQNLTLAAGRTDGESYILSKAIAEVVRDYYPNIKIDVKETAGGLENIRGLESGKFDLATVQADVRANSSVSTVAALYKDVFQLVARENSGICHFFDIKDKKIAIIENSGELLSFQKVAKYYGLQANEDFNLILTKDNNEANKMFHEQQVDAVFRVRTIGNKEIFKLVKNSNGKLVKIEQAKAMKINNLTFESVKIPKGAYQSSNPAVPNTKNFPSVGVERLLLTNKNISNILINKITGILEEHHQEISEKIADRNEYIKPLVASITRPKNISGTDIPPLHPGTLNFYQQKKPSFLQEYADYIELIWTFIFFVASSLWALLSWLQRIHKNEADEYIDIAIVLMSNEKKELNQKLNELENNLDNIDKQWVKTILKPKLDHLKNKDDIELKQDILDIVFEKAATALDKDSISQESFRTFNQAYKIAREAIERQKTREKQEISATYIEKVVTILIHQHQGNILPPELNGILKEVAEKLIQGEISQESFQTFLQTYKTTRDAFKC
ncbi:TRAP transporter solute receptor, TAXI family [Rivularia sp. PCC 7116]|uniref:TAXI family TRAP transporter solute-binding subunit n=1 Tax=Rivularia sp. PCC 7116 TaxID=373994 RepID=UPI00029EFB82|nr:TAXI family TRAP transporter solute-binding subunit [Rivularia sp. PCC 7116]AFY56817.1 TRAP transporter solute receptor, TAXI family [Rivularia sp. PCC 7116]